MRGMFATGLFLEGPMDGLWRTHPPPKKSKKWGKESRYNDLTCDNLKMCFLRSITLNVPFYKDNRVIKGTVILPLNL